MIHRLGVLLEKGAKHYGADNWTKGMPYRRTADSMIRHIFQWLAGDEEEDHLAAVCFGAMCLMTYEAATAEYPIEHVSPLDDRDKGLKKILASILTSPLKDATLKVKSTHKSVGDFVASLHATDKSLVQCSAKCGSFTYEKSGVCVACSLGNRVTDINKKVIS